MFRRSYPMKRQEQAKQLLTRVGITAINKEAYFLSYAARGVELIWRY